MKKTIIVIQARMGSHRLPGKSLMPLWKEMSLFELVLARITKAKLPDNIILATSENSLDDALIPIAEKYNVRVVRGSEDDVLGRFIKAINTTSADAVVRACADNPLLDPWMIDNLIEFFWDNKSCDYAMNLGPKTGFPDGVGVEIASVETFRRLDKEATDAFDREHVFTFLHDNPDYVSCYQYAPEEKYRRPQYRFDIDYREDYDSVVSLIDKLPVRDEPLWSTLDIIKTLDKNPEVLDLRKKRDE